MNCQWSEDIQKLTLGIWKLTLGPAIFVNTCQYLSILVTKVNFHMPNVSFWISSLNGWKLKRLLKTTRICGRICLFSTNAKCQTDVPLDFAFRLLRLPWWQKRFQQLVMSRLSTCICGRICIWGWPGGRIMGWVGPAGRICICCCGWPCCGTIWPCGRTICCIGCCICGRGCCCICGGTICGRCCCIGCCICGRIGCCCIGCCCCCCCCICCGGAPLPFPLSGCCIICGCCCCICWGGPPLNPPFCIGFCCCCIGLGCICCCMGFCCMGPGPRTRKNAMIRISKTWLLL